MELFKDILKYGLHDSEINKFVIAEEKIEIHFDNGIYKLDSFGKETLKTGKCVITLFLNNFNANRLYEHIEIYKIRKNKITEIELHKLNKLIKDYSFEIILDYYSMFERAILLKGYVANNRIEIKLSEIERIQIGFE